MSLSSLSDELLLSEELLEELLLDDSLLSSSFAKLLFGEAAVSPPSAVAADLRTVRLPDASAFSKLFFTPVGAKRCLPRDRLPFGELWIRTPISFPRPRFAPGTRALFGDALLSALLVDGVECLPFEEARLAATVSLEDLTSVLCDGEAVGDNADSRGCGWEHRLAVRALEML